MGNLEMVDISENTQILFKFLSGLRLILESSQKQKLNMQNSYFISCKTIPKNIILIFDHFFIIHYLHEFLEPPFTEREESKINEVFKKTFQND